MVSLSEATGPQATNSGDNELRSFIATRLLVLLLLLAPALAAGCQSPPAANPAWLRVESLAPGASLQVKTSSGSASCTLVAVDGDSLTCAHHGNLVFHRDRITSIALHHRGRSTLIMGGIGAGIGVAVVKLVATAGFNGFFNGKAKGGVYAGGAGLGVLVFAPIGFGTDFTHSTVYKAP